MGKGIFQGILLHGQYEDPALPGVPWRTTTPPDAQTALNMVYQEDATSNIFKFYAEDLGHQLDLSFNPFKLKGPLGSDATGPNKMFKSLARRALEQERSLKIVSASQKPKRKEESSKACVIS